ncbi:MAG TPA: PHP domain-containing protein [Nocardioidaceae bacterium]|nr:PHP domain-containing protein [Nocardioidaceae bacterium]
MRIDLHTHSDRSDGTDSPRLLMRRAREAGIDVLGLTDHDTTEGWAEAAEGAVEEGVTLVRGLEISCKLEGHGVHLTAYLPDPTYEPLVEELRRVLDGRNARLPATLERLRELGIDIEEEDVRRLAGDAAAMGRPHIADALVKKGVVSHRGEAFKSLLGSNGPAYVPRYAAPLEAMLHTVRDAGGVSVIAHPWAKRHNFAALDEARFAALKEEGLAGIEVEHQDHDEATRDRLRSIARDLDLVVTGSSDYHGAGKVDHDLGCNTTAPEEYERLLELARAASAASGRTTPEVLVP